MLQGKAILAVVPARGGSKGVKHKNIHALLGRPLVAHTAELIQQLPWIDRAVVSTDSDAIAAASEACGLGAPFRRPADLAGDRIGDWDVLDHALREMEHRDGRRYDVVLMLQPTSPLRRPEHVQATAEKLITGRWDSVWTVTPTDLKYHPLKALAISPDGTMDLFDQRGAQIIARQQLQPVYHRNGAAYAMTRECLLEQKAIRGRRCAAVVIEEEMISIDTLDDFERVQRELEGRRR
jgi:CMP-N,N'-diacetyllegionaminic acid synthase